MNILKKNFGRLLMAAVWLLPFAPALRADILIDRDPGVRRDEKLTRALEEMERAVRELLGRSRRKNSKLITVRFSGAVPPGEIRLICNQNNPILEYDKNSVDPNRDRRFRVLLYNAFYTVHHTRESGACWVKPQLPEWLTSALDLQLRLAQQTRILKGNYDLPLLRAYVEWGHLPPPEAVVLPVVSASAAERRCRAEYGYLLLTVLQDEKDALRQYLDSSRLAPARQQMELFEMLIIPALLRQARRRFPDDPKAPPMTHGQKIGQYLLHLAAKLAWTSVGIRPAANILSQLNATLTDVTVTDERNIKQRCPLSSLPRILTTLTEQEQKKTRDAVTRDVQNAVTGSSRPVAQAARVFLKSLDRLPRERKEGDKEAFEAAEKAFQNAAKELFAVLRQEAAVDDLLEKSMAEECNLPFRNDGVPEEFVKGEPLNRSVEQLLDAAELRYL